MARVSRHSHWKRTRSKTTSSGGNGLGHTVADNIISSPPSHGIGLVRDNPITGAVVVVQNNTIRDSGDSGIRAAGEDGVTLEDLPWKQTTSPAAPVGTASRATSAASRSVVMRNSRSLKIMNNDIDGGGITIRDSMDGLVGDNIVSGNRTETGFGGIWSANLDESSNITVANNRFDEITRPSTVSAESCRSPSVGLSPVAPRPLAVTPPRQPRVL